MSQTVTLSFYSRPTAYVPRLNGNREAMKAGRPFHHCMIVPMNVTEHRSVLEHGQDDKIVVSNRVPEWFNLQVEAVDDEAKSCRITCGADLYGDAMNVMDPTVHAALKAEIIEAITEHSKLKAGELKSSVSSSD